MKKISEEELEKTIKLYKELGTLDKVADYLGMTEVGVWLRLRHTGVTKVKKGPHSFVPKERHEGQVLMLENDGVKRYFYSARGAARAIGCSPQLVSMAAKGNRRYVKTCRGWTPKWIPYTTELFGKVEKA